MTRRHHRGACGWSVASVLSIVVCALIGTLVQGISAQGVARQDTSGGEWPTYGGDLASTRYAPHDQITADNFAELEVA